MWEKLVEGGIVRQSVAVCMTFFIDNIIIVCWSIRKLPVG
jgi:hypothetical protein